MKKMLCFSALLALALSAAAAPKYTFRTQREPQSGYAAPGEKITFSVQMLADGKPSELPIRVNLHAEGTKAVTETGEKGTHTMSCVAPSHGFVYFSASFTPEGEKRSVSNSGINSVAVKPEQIRQGMAELPGFDDFWANAKKQLAGPLPKADLKPVSIPAEFQDKVECFEFRIDAPGERRAYGFLALPKERANKKLPAIIVFAGAGIYEQKPELRFAAEGFLSLNISAHGVEPGADATETHLLDKLKKEHYYSAVGWDKPETCNFYWMLLRDLRALEYLKSRPEWDGKNLVSYGASQGGAQSLAISGLAPEAITYCYAGVPGLSNHGGIEADQVRGWPGNFPWNANSRITASLLDNCNFAKRVRCPVITSAAWYDFLTKPSSVYAMYNNLNVPKELRPYPNEGHGAAIRLDQAYVLEKIKANLK